MNSINHNSDDSGSQTAGNNAKPCCPASKWAALINDQHVPTPKRNVKVSVLKAQADIPEDHTLFWDVSPSEDVPLKDDEILDLAEGNVFYSRKGCFEPSEKPCSGKLKLAWFVDDHHEITLLSQQTGKSIRELFSLKDDHCLLRDLDSPNDDAIKPRETIEFAEGNVFITRCNADERKTVTVSVDGDKFEIPRKGNTPASILTAAGLDPSKRYLIEIKGNEQIPYRDTPNEAIKVRECQQFVTGALDPIPVS